jgi:RES domain-containing protein
LRVYRIFDRAYRDVALSGDGAAMWGGRWNSVGVRVVYASETLALAVLEMLANARSKVPPGKVFITLDIPSGVRIERLKRQALPVRWTESPAPLRLQEVGDAWVRSRRSVALVVPSAIVPVDHNVLLNPAHPDFRRIKVGALRGIPVDARLISSSGRRPGRERRVGRRVSS